MIQFTVNGRFSEQFVAERCSEIITGHHNTILGSPFARDGKWQLGTSNDWFLEKMGENLYEIRYRYHNHPPTIAGLDGLKSFLENIVFK